MATLHYLGPSHLLDLPKVGFLTSRQYPAEVVLKAYDWAVAQREAGTCVISGFHTPLECDVLDILLKGKQPIIICPARGVYQQVPVAHRDAFEAGRILYVTAFPPEATRMTRARAHLRNQLVLDLADEVQIGYAAPGGSLRTLLDKAKQATDAGVRSLRML